MIQFFFFNDTATTEIYTLSLHDALPICTYTQGGWGSDPSGNNPGQRLHANFARVYPNGLTVGVKGQGSMQIGRAHVLNSSHANISYAVFCLKKKKFYLKINNQNECI